MGTSLRPDPVEIRRYLNNIGIPPGEVIELRVLNALYKGSYHPFTVSGYFNDIEALTREACRIVAASGWYFTLNPCHPDLLARRWNRADKAMKGETTNDMQILRRAWLPIDFDAVRLPGISATDFEHENALKRAVDVAGYLKSEGWPKPIFADSGNGAHLLYRIDLPCEDDGLVEHILKVLDRRFSDDLVKVDTTVYNPARIWKLYGTPACKGDSTPERPHRMARILEVPGDI